ncbi:MAG: hypothetical protein ACREJS_14745, partial [Candidatus Rokuibacteriota bacterium]
MWDACIASHGLPFIARCLCVWWRVADLVTEDLPAPVLAAAVVGWVAEHSRLRPADRIAVPGADVGADASASAALE